MSATSQNGLAPKSLVNRLRNFCGGQKPRRKSSSKSNRGRSNLRFEGLEKREMFSVSSITFASLPAEIVNMNPGITGNMLVVTTDNASTGVTVSQVGSTIRISEAGSSTFREFAASEVGAVEFQGGSGNDWFENRANVPVQAMGRGGNDYLVGGKRNDLLFGNENNDVLLGGYGNDQLVGGSGADRLNGQAGIDKMWGESGSDVLISIDAAYGEYVDSGTDADADIMWIDRSGSSTDAVVGATSNDVVQEVRSFANEANRKLTGDDIADPTDSGQKVHFNNRVSAGNTQGSNPLFSSNGPQMTDIRQGALDDGKLLAGLGAIARQNPHAIRQRVVDFDDGTYGVRLGDSFYRVDNELPVLSQQNGAAVRNVRYAGLGAQNSMWVAVVEKAFTHMRENTYERIQNRLPSIQFVLGAREIEDDWQISEYSNATAMANDIASKLDAGYALTIHFDDSSRLVGAPIVPFQSYTVADVERDLAGNVTHIILRNPRGRDGAGNDGADDGLVRLTPQQLYAQDCHLRWGLV